MRRAGLLLLGGAFSAVATFSSAVAYACSPIYIPPEKQEAHEREVRARLLDDARTAASIVNVRVTETRGYSSVLTVTEILRHGGTRKSLKVGQRISVTMSPHSACGTGSLPEGTEAALIYRPDPVFSFQGFLSPAQLEILREAGLIGG